MKNESKNNKNYRATIFDDDFTNLYSFTKTLRFELKPLPETLKLLEKKNPFGKTPVEVDREIADLYERKMKPLFDKLHEKFISESLVEVKFEKEDLNKLKKLYIKLNELNKDKKVNAKEIKKLSGDFKGDDEEKEGEIGLIQKKLRKTVVEGFAKKADDLIHRLNGRETRMKKNGKTVAIDIKKDGVGFLAEEGILSVLAFYYPEEVENIEKFQGFFTYFIGFNQNRENYYSGEAKATSIANRVVNVNLVLYLNNVLDFERFLEKIPSLSEYGKYFKPDDYHDYLTQEKIEKYNDIIGEIKKKVNLEYNQKQADKKWQLRGLEKLQKQIGCLSRQQRELAEEGKSIYPPFLEKAGLGLQISKNGKGEPQIWEALQSITEDLKTKIKILRENYDTFFNNPADYDLSRIWFRKEALNTISGRWFGGDNWYIIGRALAYIGAGRIDKEEYKIPAFVNLDEIKEALKVLEEGVDFNIRKKKNKEANEAIFAYKPENLFKDEYKRHYENKNLFEAFLSVWRHEVDNKFREIFNGIEIKGKATKSYLEQFESHKSSKFNKKLKDENGRSIHAETVKNLIEDGFLRLLQLTKYHDLRKRGEIDPRPAEGKFYEALNSFWDDNTIIDYHKAFRATLTQKPYSEDKIKLNFDNGALFGGFSDGQERNKCGVILQIRGSLYLGILVDRNFFRTDIENKIYSGADSESKRLILTNLKFQTLAGKGFLGKYKISYGDLGRKDPKKAVIYLQEFIKNSYIKKYPQLKEVAAKKYNNKKEFDADIKEALTNCFTMRFDSIDEKILNEGLAGDKLYLFRIKNKDNNLKDGQEKTGKKNIHSIYWEALFSPDNLNKIYLALNGGAEIFFRSEQKDLLNKKKDKAGREIFSNKRYAEDKYFLHASITINYGRPKFIKFEEKVSNLIVSKRPDINIIGIDRGEKNLLYYSVISGSGKLLEQGSLNKIKCGDKEPDYDEILSKQAGNMMEARKNWEKIGTIKNFKEGYLSQAIHEVYQLIIKYNALVVMEDLNSQFKANRLAKVEKTVYKKFELALARKLNHLILKDKKFDKPGGVANAYQLTRYISAGDVGKFEKAKQWGIMFYVRPNYTSTTDPVTGWRKQKYISNSETPQGIKKFFAPNNSDGVKIDFDGNKKCFCFSYFVEQKSGKKITWKLHAFDGLERTYWNKNEKNEEGKFGIMKRYDLHEKFEELFGGLDKENNINKQIAANKDFDWKSLVFYWNLLNQIRNNDKNRKGDKNDFLQSPVWSDKIGGFYDSRKASEYKEKFGLDLPNNGDANGAYNIARKGLILTERIANNPKKYDKIIFDEDWDNFIQNN